jgi:hypothetical protein
MKFLYDLEKDAFNEADEAGAPTGTAEWGPFTVAVKIGKGSQEFSYKISNKDVRREEIGAAIWRYNTETYGENPWSPRTLRIGKTKRGFAAGTFKDQYGIDCSIQESSLATEACIWLGADEIGLKRFEPGKGWSDVPLENSGPGGISHTANTRMHLSRENVIALLPLLQHFINYGTLPEIEPQPDKANNA